MLLFPLFLAALAIALLFYNYVWKRRDLPPGPAPLPILGNGPAFCGENRYSAWQKWTQQYGPVFTVWIGERPVVVVTDYELIKQTFVKDANSYTGRDFLRNHFTLMRGEVNGVMRTEGEQWKELREFLHRAMRNYGTEKGAIEREVLQAVRMVVGEVEEALRQNDLQHQEGLALDRMVDLMSGSVINSLLFGYPFYGERYKDFVFMKEMMDLQEEYLISLKGLLIEQLPWLRHLPLFARDYKKFAWSVDQVFQFCEREIRARIGEREGGKYLPKGDILDQFLDEMDKSDQQDPHHYFKLRYLSALCYDVFVAGQETTSNTLNFLILFMMLDQEAQAKLHAELDKVAKEKREEIAADREEEVQFTMADRIKLPYANAICNETQRVINLLPLNLTKRVSRDVQMGGHQLRSGTTVVNQICAVLYDHRVFPDPERFEPERFLDEMGRLKRVEELIPFGTGKRICPGESLARMELLLFTANFFLKFRVCPVDPLHPPKYEKRQTLTVKLPHFKCRVIEREQQ